jgi:hypothetical protein
MKYRRRFSRVMGSQCGLSISKGLKPLLETGSKYSFQHRNLYSSAFKVLAFLLLIPALNLALAHRFYWNPDSMSLETAFVLDTLPLSSFVLGELEPGETDFFQLPLPKGEQTILALLAPQACPDFLPELWVIAKTLPETEEAPFEIPEGYKSLQVNNEWQPYKDYIITARLGPNVRLALDESNYYFAVYAGEATGNYIAIKIGRDTIGGTEEGFDALARFVRCEKVAAP